ncbi:unnamed protein product [Bemisia tabaci]|uniref:Uncharacterized protein n=1 Tax=Bemisia tabaci TaxID=7038 RepID=A0A9P0CF68_BEMTA|nr:unnamed protein product [Bemisia tabaci]
MAIDQMIPLISTVSKILQPLKAFFRMLPPLLKMPMQIMQSKNYSPAPYTQSGAFKSNELSDAALSIFQLMSDFLTATNFTSAVESLAFGEGHSTSEEPVYNGIMDFLNAITVPNNFTDTAHTR